MTLTIYRLISRFACTLPDMKYLVTGPCAVHDNLPGAIVEPDETWDVDFLLATGHLEPAEVPATKPKKTEPVETENE